MASEEQNLRDQIDILTLQLRSVSDLCDAYVAECEQLRATVRGLEQVLGEERASRLEEAVLNAREIERRDREAEKREEEA